MLWVPELEVGHVDVHDSVHPANALKTVVGRGVVNQRQTQTPFDRDYQRCQSLRNHLLRRDDVDCVATDSLQIEHDLREFGGTHLRAFAELAGLEVLTEDAA